MSTSYCGKICEAVTRHRYRLAEPLSHTYALRSTRDQMRRVVHRDVVPNGQGRKREDEIFRCLPTLLGGGATASMPDMMARRIGVSPQLSPAHDGAPDGTLRPT